EGLGGTRCILDRTLYRLRYWLPAVTHQQHLLRRRRSQWPVLAVPQWMSVCDLHLLTVRMRPLHRSRALTYAFYLLVLSARQYGRCLRLYDPLYKTRTILLNNSVFGCCGCVFV